MFITQCYRTYTVNVMYQTFVHQLKKNLSTVARFVRIQIQTVYSYSLYILYDYEYDILSTKKKFIVLGNMYTDSDSSDTAIVILVRTIIS